MIYPGPADNLTQRAKEFVKSRTLPANFVFVTDPDYKVTEAYGLHWDAAQGDGLSVDLRVIDPAGIVRFSNFSRTHGDRANPKEIFRHGQREGAAEAAAECGRDLCGRPGLRRPGVLTGIRRSRRRTSIGWPAKGCG